MACPVFFAAKKPVAFSENVDCYKDSNDIDCNFLCHIFFKNYAKIAIFCLHIVTFVKNLALLKYE
jgi:hypothetical protein